MFMKLSWIDMLFWMFLFIALGYVIGKLAGLIHTSEWVGLLPVISIIFAAGIAYQKLVSFASLTNRRTNYLKKHLDIVEKWQAETDRTLFSLQEKQDIILGMVKKNF